MPLARCRAVAMGSDPFRRQTRGARVGQQSFELTGLFERGLPAGGSQPIITPPFIVMLRVGTFFEFLNQTFFEQSFDSTIQRAGAQAHGAAGAFGDLLDDGIAMP